MSILSEFIKKEKPVLVGAIKNTIQTKLSKSAAPGQGLGGLFSSLFSPTKVTAPSTPKTVTVGNKLSLGLGNFNNLFSGFLQKPIAPGDAPSLKAANTSQAPNAFIPNILNAAFGIYERAVQYTKDQGMPQNQNVGTAESSVESALSMKPILLYVLGGAFIIFVLFKLLRK